MYALFLLFLLVTASCEEKTVAVNPLFDQFQIALDSQLNENMPGILVSVDAKKYGLSWSGSAGYSDKATQTPLLPHQTFRIASVTKTFVPATVLRLWEEDKLKLDDPIELYISSEHADLLRSDGYEPENITIYHLLTHSSGMAEHTGTEKYQLPFITTNYNWTRTLQIQELVEFTEPVGAIGEKFSYSDTGYILLGELIEKITGKSLGEAITEQLKLHELGLHSIHMEEAGGEMSEERIHQYYQNVDTYAINPTIDLYGGGGLLANTQDLSQFYSLLLEGKIFKNASTLERMLATADHSTPSGMDYRMGIWQTEVEGMKAYTHSGFWGTQVVYIPEIQTSIAANYSQYWNKRGNAPIIGTLIHALMNTQEEE